MERNQVGQYEQLISGIEEKIRDLSRRKKERRGKSEGVDRRLNLTTDTSVIKGRHQESSKDWRQERSFQMAHPSENIVINSQEVVSVITPFVIEYVKEYLKGFKSSFLGETKTYISSLVNSNKLSSHTARTSVAGQPSATDIRETQHHSYTTSAPLESAGMNALVYKISQLEQAVVGAADPEQTRTAHLPAHFRERRVPQNGLAAGRAPARPAQRLSAADHLRQPGPIRPPGRGQEAAEQRPPRAVCGEAHEGHHGLEHEQVRAEEVCDEAGAEAQRERDGHHQLGAQPQPQRRAQLRAGAEVPREQAAVRAV